MVERVSHKNAKENAFYRINVEYIIEALEWLKDNNPYYHDIEINYKRYEHLPKDATIFDLEG